MSRFVQKELIYANPLAESGDVKAFRMEGDGAVSFPLGRLRMESVPDGAQRMANIVFWCPEDLPDVLSISWDFWPIREPGLCMLFFAAQGRHGEDLFDAGLPPRDGDYPQYHHGDINAYHVSYFRRKAPEERRMHTCHLRKSYGFHLVAQGADPIPSVAQAVAPYRMHVTSFLGEVELSIDGLASFRWTDDGSIGGPRLGAGKIGFRQMAPLIAEYANLEIHRVEKRQLR